MLKKQDEHKGAGRRTSAGALRVHSLTRRASEEEPYVVLDVYVCASANQQLSDCLSPEGGRLVKRRDSICVLVVRLRALF